MPAEGTREERITALTAPVTTRLEGAIRGAPEQWVWMHERWKTTPEVVERLKKEGVIKS